MSAAGGWPPDERRRERQARAGPLLAAFRRRLDATEPKLSRRSDLAVGIRYTLARWPAFVRYIDDSRLKLDNNAANRSLRGANVGRKNWLLASSDQGGYRAATIRSLVETAKLNGVDPEAWLTDIIARIADHPARRIGGTLPWNYRPA
jgi:hypothetical protein